MNEYISNLHSHTCYSDGTYTHTELAQAAAQAGLDVVLVTDHNIWVDKVQGHYQTSYKRVLLLTGEEVHDAARQPQSNHLLVYGTHQELCRYAHDPQKLISQVQKHNGVSFIAHPTDPDAARFHEPSIPWVNWDVHGFTGLEIWNYMSSLKHYLHSYRQAIPAILSPHTHILAPDPAALQLWDRLLSAGQVVVGIGNADAHGTRYRLGIWEQAVLAYEFLFRAVNTHLLLPELLADDWQLAEQQVYTALRTGSCFIGYDYMTPTRGFRFWADCASTQTVLPMGAQAAWQPDWQLYIETPQPCTIRVIQNGQCIYQANNQQRCQLPAPTRGAYRCEALLNHRKRTYGWIYSNPIYLE